MKKLLLTLLTMMLLSGCTSESTPSNETTEETNTLRVGMECNYAPFNWSDPNSNETNVEISAGGFCDGYDVTIAKNIADQLGQELEVVKLDWDALEPALNTGEIDLIIAGMTATDERRENAEFTTAYYQSEMVMIVRKDDALASATTLEDFSGKNVIGQLNTLYDTVIDQIPDVNHLTPLESYPYLIASLKNGEADAITAETPVGLGAITAHSDLALVEFAPGEGFDIDLSTTSVSIAVAKGNTELLNEVQTALDAISEEQRATYMEEAIVRQPVNN